MFLKIYLNLQNIILTLTCFPFLSPTELHTPDYHFILSNNRFPTLQLKLKKKSILQWTKEDCFEFLDLSEPSQKHILPQYGKPQAQRRVVLARLDKIFYDSKHRNRTSRSDTETTELDNIPPLNAIQSDKQQ